MGRRLAGRLTLPGLMTFSIITVPASAVGIAMSIYLSPYFTGHLGVSLTAVGAAFFIVRMIDIPIDPVLGVLMDGTRTVVGRYRLWLLLGAPFLMVAVHQLFMAPMGIGQSYLIVWLLVLYLGLSILSLAQGAWSATLAPDYNERSRLFGVLAVAGVAANVMVLAIPIAGKAFRFTDADSVHAIGWLVIGLTPVCIGLVAWRVKERVVADVHTERFPLADYLSLAFKPAMIRLFLAQAALTLGPGWMSALYIFFFKDVLGFPFAASSGLLIVYILAGVAGAPTTAWVSARLGKHRTLMITTTAYSLGLCSILIMPKNNLLAVTPVMFWCGFMASGFGLLVASMTADVGDEVRLEQGKQRMSLIYSLIGLATKIAGAGAFFLSFYLLARFGYNPKDGAHNTVAAIRALELTFILGPIFFVMLGGACVVGWRLDARRHGEIRSQLDARDSALGEAALIDGLTGQAVIPLLAAEPD
jgi:glycoside/pentoside/hexuronide:cation symporter, GPH family